MDAYFITFRSITAAQRGERILNEAGISAALQRTPRWMQEQGCGYSLRLGGARAAQAVGALRQRGAVFAKVYIQSAGGEIREAQL